MICLALVIIAFFNTYRRKMSEKEAKIKNMALEAELEIFKSATEAEEKQKETLAKNLHDGIIPTLSAVERSIDKNIKDFHSEHFDIERLKKDLGYLEDIAKNIRGISHDLALQSLLSKGLLHALGDYVEQIGNAEDAMADFENTTSFGKNLPFAYNEQVNIYRVCLELLNNLYKHARYKYLKMIVEKNGNYLDFVFMHDGKGITNEEIETLSNDADGIGLKSLKSRAQMLSARYDYVVEKETASITFSVPIKK